jgi:hypothetical protein
MRIGAVLPVNAPTGGHIGGRDIAIGAALMERLGFARFEAELRRLQELLRTGRSREGDVDLTPWPAVRGGPPVLLGAWRGSWVERAAKDADGWIASAGHNDEATLAGGLARYRDAGGRRAVVTNVRVEKDLDPAVERLHRLREMGFDDGVALVIRPTEERLAALLEAVS